jgi:hypothetical protein
LCTQDRKMRKVVTRRRLRYRTLLCCAYLCSGSRSIDLGAVGRDIRRDSRTGWPSGAGEQRIRLNVGPWLAMNETSLTHANLLRTVAGDSSSASGPAALPS